MRPSSSTGTTPGAATVIRKGGVTLRSVDGLRSRIDQLIGVLTAVADDPDAFKS
jgi:hypothetical protein